LERVLLGVAAQSRPPDAVLVVDNGSAADTARALSGLKTRVPQLESLRLEENLGPAGGFAAGLSSASERDFTHVWAMDDDVEIAPGCLEALIAAVGEHEEVLLPEVRNRMGKVTNFPGWSAVLLPVSAIRRAGPPNADFFWWVEDTEYLQWRLPKRFGVRLRVVPEAAATHGDERGRERPAWRLYYEVRNTLHYRLRIQTGRWRRRLGRIAVVICSALWSALRGPGRVRKLRSVGMGIRDGLLGRLGKAIDPGLT
jgi:GT2 family glycosyltransferase